MQNSNRRYGWGIGRGVGWGFGLVAFLALPWMVFFPLGCDWGKVTDAPAPTDSQAVKKATLTLTNDKIKDAGTMTFKLWGPLAQEIFQATPIHTLGDVKSGETKAFTLPVGNWKVGYQLEGLTYHEMPDADTSGGEWPQVAFADSGKYNLRIYTNTVDNRDYWIHNLPILP